MARRTHRHGSGPNAGRGGDRHAWAGSIRSTHTEGAKADPMKVQVHIPHHHPSSPGDASTRNFSGPVCGSGWFVDVDPTEQLTTCRLGCHLGFCFPSHLDDPFARPCLPSLPVCRELVPIGDITAARFKLDSLHTVTTLQAWLLQKSHYLSWRRPLIHEFHTQWHTICSTRFATEQTLLSTVAIMDLLRSC